MDYLLERNGNGDRKNSWLVSFKGDFNKIGDFMRFGFCQTYRDLMGVNQQKW